MVKASERDRYKYGVCTNHDREGKPCPKCESKEVQKIRMGQDFVCEECKESLRQVPPPKQSTSPKMIAGIIIGILLILGCGTGAFFFFNGKGKSDRTEVKTVVDKTVDNIDTSKTLSVPVATKSENSEKQKSPITASNAVIKSTVSVPGGRYAGEVKNGKPHGQGTLTYNRYTRISMRDMKERYAEAGQYVIGEFYEGELVHGTLYSANNEPIESIRIGR